MDVTVEESENWIKLSKEIFGFDVDNGEGPKFFSLSHFFTQLDQMAWNDAVETGRAGRLSREGCRNVSSFSTATAIFEEDPFLYRMAVHDSCPFHQALENVRFCSLNVVKRRVFAMCDISGVKLNIGMKPGRHAPLSGTESAGSRRRIKIQQQGDHLKAQTFYKSVAVVREDTNVFGVPVSARTGSMGGHTFTNPEIDPAPIARQYKKKVEKQMRKEMSKLVLVDEEDVEIPSGVETVKPSDIVADELDDLDDDVDDDDDDDDKLGQQNQESETSSLFSNSSFSYPTAATDSEGLSAAAAIMSQKFVETTASATAATSDGRMRKQRDPEEDDEVCSVVSSTSATSSTRKYRLLAKFRDRPAPPQ